MLTVYYSNLLNAQKALLTRFLEVAPTSDPLEPEIILVQSKGMAQWLQLQLASVQGIAANIHFAFPSHFLWQQYRLLFPHLPKENVFNRELIVWRLMEIIPECLDLAHFYPLKEYLRGQQDQTKLFQLADKIAGLFDQYLVYRPEWLVEWESGKTSIISTQIEQAYNQEKREDIFAEINWQADLWKILVNKIKESTEEDIFITSHRAYIQQRYITKLDNLTEQEKSQLPKRIFIFGISSLPQSELDILTKLSAFSEIHLFFISPSKYYWGDLIEQKMQDKLALIKGGKATENEGNSLLAMWGKQGRDFYTNLVEREYHSLDPVYLDYSQDTLLNKIKRSILELEEEYVLDTADSSIQIHSCHSALREVEVLHDQLLHLFEADPNLSPKDIIVMSPDIDKYAPYIHAVFTRYSREDNRYIPYSLSDQKEIEIDPVINSFINLLNFKESLFSAEQLLELLDVEAIRNKFNFSEIDIGLLRNYIEKSGIRTGIDKYNNGWVNYNTWQNGLERLLLGNSLKTENGAWLETIALDESYGLGAELIGKLTLFVQYLMDWQRILQGAYPFEEWQHHLLTLINHIYDENESNIESLVKITQAIDVINENIKQSETKLTLEIDILASLFEKHFANPRNGLHFLSGKVNFCTLLPMRAIPFKVVCLLGMNESDFPRQTVKDKFDLMQYLPKRGDRARRDDDRYLFLEALLSAQDVFYISYIGQSLKNNKEEFPSILVSQLMDYIQRNGVDWKEYLLIEHPMTAYSQNNFIGDNRSYAKEWLGLSTADYANSNFLEKINHQFIEQEIELNELIAYLQEPIKYFFTRYLGIYFSSADEQIEENEVFELSHLDNYRFFEALLFLEESEIENFFYQEKLKGNLPASSFAKISEKTLESQVKAIRHAVEKYKNIEPTSFEVNCAFNVAEKSINLTSEMTNKYDQDIIFWRVGKLRDKDIIHLWVHHLLVCLDGTFQGKVILYYKDSEKAETLCFNSIPPDVAYNLLSKYMRDYVSSANELCFGIYYQLNDYFKNLDKNKENLDEYVQKYMSAISEHYDGKYMQRVLEQSSDLNYLDIAQRTSDWFQTMIEAQIISEV